MGLKDLTQREGCPIRGVLDRIGDRWSMLILIALEEGEAVRFTALKRMIGDISPRMLAQTLRLLEQDGLVSRTVYPSVPPRVDYQLTALGRSMMEPLNALVRWADDSQPAIEAARAAYVPPPPQVAL